MNMRNTIKKRNTALNQYLGTCLKCRKFEALSRIEGFCYNCLDKKMKGGKKE